MIRQHDDASNGGSKEEKKKTVIDGRYNATTIGFNGTSDKINIQSSREKGHGRGRILVKTNELTTLTTITTIGQL